MERDLFMLDTTPQHHRHRVPSDLYPGLRSSYLHMTLNLVLAESDLSAGRRGSWLNILYHTTFVLSSQDFSGLTIDMACSVSPSLSFPSSYQTPGA